tara:strand:+ start:328 stop:483 length:156 start_codon:yes stop_codon:yes gene_type:complete
MSHHLPEDLTRDGYTPTSPLDSRATNEDIINKINELVAKVEELVELFIGPE